MHKGMTDSRLCFLRMRSDDRIMVRLLLALCLAPGLLAMQMRWVDYSYVFAGFSLCNNATGVCRSLGHWVYTISPESFTRNIVSAAEYRIDDGPWQAGQSGNFEAHICNGQCSNTSDASSCEYYKDTEGREQLAQVWNYGYDAVHAPAATAGGAAAPAPKRVCVRAWALDAATGERGELPEACNDMTPATFHLPLRPLAWKTQFLYSLSAEVATHMCAADGSYCRTNAHNSFDVSVADPTDVVAATTEYSIDGGAWGTASGVTFFEQKVKKVGDDWFHTFSWNYDVLTKGKGARAAAPKQICFRSWVQNRLSGETAWLDFGPDAQQGRPPTERCIAFCDHAMPFSYAPQAGGYCAQKP